MISACLVIRNEEKLLPRCLDSIKDIADEIIIVHDGECDDGSLEIAKKYNSQIFIQPLVGEAEYHRPFTFEKSRHPWILQIDADEYIDKNDGKKIKELVKSEIIDGYSFLWPYYTGLEYIRKGPFAKTYKPCLFRKEKMYMLGISHEYPRTYGLLEKREDIMLYHMNNYLRYNEANFQAKWVAWAKIQAEQIYNLEKAPTYNIKDLKSLSLYSYYNFMRSHPLLSGFGETLRFLLIYFLRGILFTNLTSYRIAFYEIRYLWLIRKFLTHLKHG